MYNMSLGGRADEDTTLGHSCTKVPAKRVIPIILKIVEIFKSEKRAGETLDVWVRRVIQGDGGPNVKSLDDIKELLQSTIVVPTKDQDADFYADYGNDTSYHAKTGRGECAA